MRNVEKILEYCLSRPPTKADMRVRSERELSEILGVNQMKIHRALNRLSDKGVLIRRHGSGTFVRKISNFSSDEKGEWISEAKRLSKRIFAEPSHGRRLSRNQRKLHLGLWSDFQYSNQASHLIMDGMSEKVQEAGHSLVFKSLVKKQDVPLGVEEVAADLRKSPCDGYMVVTRWAWLFEQALAMAWGDASAPMTYVFPCSYSTGHQPLVEVDTDAGIARAVEIFVANNYHRIGFIHTPDALVVHGERTCEQVYSGELLRHGLDYRAVEFVSPEDNDVKTAMDKLLNRGDPPQAIYVADDHLMHGIEKYFSEEGIVPGQDIALITLSNQGIELPDGYNWSRLEFQPKVVGRLAVESLVRVIGTAGEELCSFSNKPAWIPGDTHAPQRKEAMSVEKMMERNANVLLSVGALMER